MRSSCLRFLKNVARKYFTCHQFLAKVQNFTHFTKFFWASYGACRRSPVRAPPAVFLGDYCGLDCTFKTREAPLAITYLTSLATSPIQAKVIRQVQTIDTFCTGNDNYHTVTFKLITEMLLNYVIKFTVLLKVYISSWRLAK